MRAMMTRLGWNRWSDRAAPAFAAPLASDAPAAAPPGGGADHPPVAGQDRRADPDGDRRADRGPRHAGPDDPDLHRLSSELGFEIIDVAGFLQDMDARCGEQRRTLDQTLALTGQVLGTGTAMSEGLDRIGTAADDALQSSQQTLAEMRGSITLSRDVAAWVSSVVARVRDISAALHLMEQRTAMIEDIATQVSMLSVNAGIEASRAGDAGRGFAVIARTIKQLSDQTNETTDDMREQAQSLGRSVRTLAEEADKTMQDAQKVISDSQISDQRITSIASKISDLRDTTTAVRHQAAEVRQANARFNAAIQDFVRTVDSSAADLHRASARVDQLIDRSETLVQASAKHSRGGPDDPFVQRVQQDAAQLGKALEQALATGQITEERLFTRRYTPIPMTDPQQYDAPFCRLTDALFTPTQEAALSLSDKVVFCAAVTLDGYLPTHNRKFSHPQRRDPEWNAAHARNRRLFDDRVGRKAGQNMSPFLLQIYRRDMGKGVKVLMKDVSAPIMVNGRHWGGLRLAYKV